MDAFDFAEKFQTPVFVMSDLDLGMNLWMADPFAYPEKPISRGKILTAEDLDRLGGFGRYADVDGDGIPYRTLPGTKHNKAAFFTRGSGHNDKAQYTEREDDYVNNVDRLTRKFETMRQFVPAPIVQDNPKARIGLVASGTSDYAVRECIDQLRKEYGIEAAYLRLRAYPFTQELNDFIDRYGRIYVIDQNRDGQWLALMRMEFDPAVIAKLRSVKYYGGLPLDARTLTSDIVQQERQ
jgi:2-oxoglutarate ferredoxin oxidoreductase subunit alpha